MAENARYGLADGSGQRNSTRFAFGLFEYKRYAAGGGAVALRVNQVDRSFVTWDQALVAVGRRRREGQDGGGVL